MRYVEPEVVEQVRRIDLLTYLRTCEPQELVRISPNCYSTRTHDSLKISNGKWMWWSRRIGGYNALDYLVKVRGFSFLEAVETLAGMAAVTPAPKPVLHPKKEVPKKLHLPDRNASTDRVTAYLCGRGLDRAIVEGCVTNRLIYESLPYHNAVFVGYDRENKPRYASFRATNSSRIMGDCAGSDKHFSFRIVNQDSDSVHLFESAIDLLSYATQEKLAGRDWRRDNLVSLSGVYLPKEKVEDSTVPLALAQFLSDRPGIRRIILHLDNDNAGRSASRALQAILSDRYEVVDELPMQGKDYNDMLCLRLGLFKKKSRARGQER